MNIVTRQGGEATLISFALNESYLTNMQAQKQLAVDQSSARNIRYSGYSTTANTTHSDPVCGYVSESSLSVGTPSVSFSSARANLLASCSSP